MAKGDWQKVGLKHPTGPEWDEHQLVSDIVTGKAYKNVSNVPMKIKADDQGTYIYYGFAKPGSLTSVAVWRVFREHTDTGDVDFAGGTDDFTNIWDDHLGASYS